MNRYDVYLNNDSRKTINADRFHVVPSDRLLYFYRDNIVVACFDGWIGFTLVEVSEVPICSPAGKGGHQ